MIFTYSSDGFKDSFPDLSGRYNVFLSNIDGTDLVPLTNGKMGNTGVEAISPDGNKVLISAFTYSRKKDNGAKLYLFDLNDLESEPIQIAHGFSKNSYAPATAWINNSEIVYLGNGDEGYGFYVMNINNFEARKLKPYTENPEAILGVNEDHVYWYTRVKVGRGDYQAVWWTSIDGSDQGKLETNGVQVIYFSGGNFSPDGKKVAWIPQAPEPECDTKEKRDALYASGDYASTCILLYAADLSDMDHPMKIPLVPKEGNIPEYHQYKPFQYLLEWSPNSSELFILNPGSHSPAYMYYIDFGQSKPEFVWLENFPSVRDDNEAWYPTIKGFSPDGRQIFVRKIIVRNTSELIFVNLDSMTLEEKIPYGLNHDEIYRVYFLP